MIEMSGWERIIFEISNEIVKMKIPAGMGEGGDRFCPFMNEILNKLKERNLLNMGEVDKYGKHHQN